MAAMAQTADIPATALELNVDPLLPLEIDSEVTECA